MEISSLSSPSWNPESSTPSSPTPPTELVLIQGDSASDRQSITTTRIRLTSPGTLSQSFWQKAFESADLGPIFSSSAMLISSGGSRILLCEQDGSHLELQSPGKSLTLKGWRLGEEKDFDELLNGFFSLEKVRRGSFTPQSTYSDTTGSPGMIGPTVRKSQLLSFASYLQPLLFPVIMCSILVAAVALASKLLLH